MDTRGKILIPEQALERAREARAAGCPVRVVTGRFDPLLPAHARRLSELAEPGGWLMVVVTDAPEPILPARARAELVAALRVVDCVVVGASAVWEDIPADSVLHEETADRRRTRDFVAHVRARQGG